MSELSPKPGEVTDLSEERAELLPPRSTLAAVEIGRNEFDPFNFPVGSPESNNASVDAHAESQVAGGFMPVVITLAPSINIINQSSGSDDGFFADWWNWLTGWWRDDR